MKIFVRSILLVVLWSVIPFSAVAQERVVERTDNKVVIEGAMYYLHTVQEKQTLFAICKAYGVSMGEVMRVNGKKVAAVNIDEVLRIPVVHKKIIATPQIVRKEDDKYKYHLVKKGETLFSISKIYNVEQSLVVEANPGSDLSLSLGSTLRIPKIVKSVEEKPVAPRDSRYYYHKVQPKETEFSISRKYGIKLRKLRKLNPSIKREGLKDGAFVRIPKAHAPEVVESVERDVVEPIQDVVEEVKDTIPAIQYLQPNMAKRVHLAVMLPLYLEANDTINQIKVVEENMQVVKEREQRIIYPRSHTFLRFYQGILLAVDSLRKEGISIDLHVYDTQKSVSKVEQILSRPEFHEMDMIIGPVYSSTFNVAANFAQRFQIPIVSPLSARNSVIKTNPYVFQLNTSIESLCERLANYVIQNHSSHNLVVVHPQKFKHLNEYNLVTSLEQDLFYGGRFWSKDRGMYKKISFDEYGLYGISGALCDSCENVVLIPSTSQPVVDNIVTNLNVLSGRYKIRLMGFPVWRHFNSMDPENFYSLNMSVLSPYNVDYENLPVEQFVNRFRTEFKAEPNDFSFRAYDLCMYFSKAISAYGKHFYDHFDEIECNQLQGLFKFERVGNFGGFENRGLHLINYSHDYSIEHSIPQWRDPSKSLWDPFLEP